MKRFVLTTLILIATCMLGIAAVADGTSKENAIPFDWEKGNLQPATATDVWYKISLAPLYDEDDPYLTLYLINMADVPNEVMAEATLLSNSMEYDKTIAPHSNVLLSKSVAQLVKMNQKLVYLKLRCSHDLRLAASVTDYVEMDNGCVDAPYLTYNIPTTQNKGEAWYKLNIADAKNDAAKTIRYVLQNTSAQEAQVLLQESPDCPSTGVTTKTVHIPAYTTVYDTILRMDIDAKAMDETYLQVQASQNIKIHPELITMPTMPVVDFSSATQFNLYQETIIPAGEHYYYIPIDSLRGKKMMPEMTIQNLSTTEVLNITEVLAYQVKTSATKTLDASLQPDGISVVTMQRNQIEAIAANYDTLFIKLVNSQPINAYVRLKHVREGDACKSAAPFEFGKNVMQEPGNFWYAVDLSKQKQGGQLYDLRLVGKNLSTTQTTNLLLQMALECPYLDLQTLEKAVGPKGEFDKIVNNSTLQMLGTSTIYMGVQSEQPLELFAEWVPTAVLPVDSACVNGTHFNWNEGHTLPKDTTAWFIVDMTPLKNTELLPSAIINNRAGQNATVQIEVSTECPDSLPNQTRELILDANGTAQETASKDFMRNFDKTISFLYVKLTTDQPIDFHINFVTPDEGADCQKAIPFNWTSGNHQKPEQGALWYSVDLTQAKLLHKDVMVTYTNKSNTKQNQVILDFAPNCPCNQPQRRILELNPGETKQVLHPYAAVELVDTFIYYRVACEQPIHMQAELLDPTPFTDASCSTHQEVEWGYKYKHEGTAWYTINTDTLNNTEYTSNISLYNSDQINTLTVQVAFDCPVNQTMLTNSITLQPGQELHQLIEREVALLGAGKTAYVKLQSDHKLNFSFNLQDPNDGVDCSHAIILDTLSSHIQLANEEKWYRINVNELKTNNKGIEIGVKNIDTKTGYIHASLYEHCDSAIITSQSANIGAKQLVTKQIASATIQGMAMDYLYIYVETKVDDSIYIKYIDDLLTDTIFACQEAIALAPNIDYHQAAGDTVWYELDISNLQLNTKGDAMLKVFNHADTSTHVQVEVSWECPVAHTMAKRTEVLNPQDTLLKTITRANMQSVEKPIAYLRIVPNADITFQFEAQLSKGEDCLEPIVFDWEKGNVHPGGGKYLFYQIKMDSTIFPEGKDLRLWVVNEENDSTTAGTDIRMGECDSEILMTVEQGFAPYEAKSKDIDRDLVKHLGWVDIILGYRSDSATTRIYIEFIPERADSIVRDTIYDVVCDGAFYTFSDTIGQKDIVREILSFDEETWYWSDTTQVIENTWLIEYIKDFHVRPIMPHQALTTHQLDSLHALPLVVQGMQIEVQPSLDSIAAYYQRIAQDTLAKVDSIYWQTLDGKSIAEAYPAPLTKEQKTLALQYVLLDSCENMVESNVINIVAQPWRYDSLVVVQDSVLCQNTIVQTRNNPSLMVTNDTIVRDTVFNIATTDTLSLTRLIDSVYIYNFRVYKQPELYTTLKSKPRVAAGKTLQVGLATQVLWADFTYDYPQDDNEYMHVESIFWQSKDTATQTYLPIDTVSLLDSLTQTVQLRYAVVTSCQDTLYSNDFTLEAEAYTRLVQPTEASVCYEETYNTRLTTLTITSDTTWSDTLCLTASETYNGQALTYQYDSIYTYDINVLPVYKDIKDTVYVCEHDLPYMWEGHPYQAGEWIDTLNTIHGCDSIVTLTVIALPTLTGTQELFVCPNEQVQWEGNSYGVGTHVDTLTSLVTGCDSIVTLTVTELPILTGTQELFVCPNEQVQWEGNSYPVGTFVDTLTSLVTGCDSIVTLTVTELPILTYQMADTICDNQVYEWNGQSLNKTGEYKVTLTSFITGCDSIVTLSLTVNPTQYTEVYDTICPADTREYYYDTLTTVLGCDSVVKHNLIKYHMLWENDWLQGIRTVCGEPINVNIPDSVVKEQIQNDILYAPNTQVAWFAKLQDEWQPIGQIQQLLNGGEMIQIMCQLTSDCATVQDSITQLVELPSADNTTDFDQLPAEAMFGNRMLMINYRYIKDTLGFSEITQDSVEWYLAEDGVIDDLTLLPEVGNDKKVGTGYYYTTGEPLVGMYYARLLYSESEQHPCGITARTNIITCTPVQYAPTITPSIASPGQTLEIQGLNPQEVCDVKTYNGQGLQVQQIHTVQKAQTIQIKAQNTPGCYLIELWMGEQVYTFKYIVK